MLKFLVALSVVLFVYASEDTATNVEFDVSKDDAAVAEEAPAAEEKAEVPVEEEKAATEEEVPVDEEEEEKEEEKEEYPVPQLKDEDKVDPPPTLAQLKASQVTTLFCCLLPTSRMTSDNINFKSTSHLTNLLRSFSLS